ncbi:MAG: 3-hydroxy-3-methylglutaryl-CoA reductase [Firmicutes bacterium]|nr:3-hydroxy-3-methylglutaryl-CoA reductase [Bacillota bacterium]
MHKDQWPHRNQAQEVAYRQQLLKQLPEWQPEDDRVFAAGEHLTALAPFQECLTGEMVLPVGIVGPLEIELGQYAGFDAEGIPAESGRQRDKVYVPLAHTEGGLSVSMLRGMRAIQAAGGAKTYMLGDRMTRDSAFVFQSPDDAVAMQRWLTTHEAVLKTWIMQQGARGGPSVSSHAELQKISVRLIGSVCHVLYGFYTHEACGPNMMTRNAYALNQEILQRIAKEGLHPDALYLEANLGGDKKPSYEYFAGGHGKTVMAHIMLPDRVLSRHLHVTAQDLADLEWTGLHGAHVSGMQSFAFTPASAVAAVFAATGQDLGMVGTSSMAEGAIRRVPGGISFSLTLGGVEVGTVGGGTQLPHAQTYLRMMKCQGPGSSQRLAQIIAGAALALEISASASMASRHSRNFFQAHWLRGGERHAPPQETP